MDIQETRTGWLGLLAKLGLTIFTALFVFFLYKPLIPVKYKAGPAEQTLAVQPVASKTSFKILAVTPQYADICRLIGAEHVEVDSIIKNTTANPHHFIVDHADIQRFQDTDIFILNGLNYDTQIEQAVRSARQGANIIVVATLDKTNARNPHLWFASKTYQRLAFRICQELKTALPERSALFEQNYQKVLLVQSAINAKIAYMKKQHQNISAFSNEPILNLLLQELNIDLFDETVQLVCSHGHEPAGATYINLINKLKRQRPTFFILNKQTDNVLSKVIKQAARDYKVPVIYVDEILPVNLHAFNWLEQTIDAIHRAVVAGRKS